MSLAYIAREKNFVSQYRRNFYIDGKIEQAFAAQPLLQVHNSRQRRGRSGLCFYRRGEICDALPLQFFCFDRFLVYKFECKTCKNFYIGETSRPFHFRYKEHHKSSLQKKDLKSALAEHAILCPSFIISDFKLSILSRCRSPVETRLTEARDIDFLRPEINRRHEKQRL